MGAQEFHTPRQDKGIPDALLETHVKQENKEGIRSDSPKYGLWWGRKTRV